GWDVSAVISRPPHGRPYSCSADSSVRNLDVLCVLARDSLTRRGSRRRESASLFSSGYWPGAAALRVKWMSTTPQLRAVAWCWALIAAEGVVVGYFGASLSAGRKVRLDGGALLSVLVFVAWLFLFLGSPFLVRSQRW